MTLPHRNLPIGHNVSFVYFLYFAVQKMTSVQSPPQFELSVSGVDASMGAS